MSKLYCCGITCAYEIDKIRELINSTKDYFDGYIWCADEKNSDEIYKLLDDNKKDGKIYKHLWTNNHDFQANEYLLNGHIKNEDWVYICDSSETPSHFWLERMKNDISEYEKQGIGAVYASGRPFLFQYFDHQFYFLSPHWSLQGVVGNVISIPDEEKDKYIINKRKLDPNKHYAIHNTKYLYCYGRSNATQLFYGKYGQNIVNAHETERFKFRHYCRKELGLGFTLDSLEEYMKKGNFTQYFIDYCELEFSMSEFYQIKILGKDLIKDIVPVRYKFSFRDFLNGGDGFPENYESTIIRLNKQFNIKE